jgi:hypothetical protein
VDDPGRAVQDTVEHRPVTDLAADQPHLPGEPVGPPGREVVQHDQVDTGGMQRRHHVATDVTGPTGHHPPAHRCHGVSPGSDHDLEGR